VRHAVPPVEYARSGDDIGGIGVHTLKGVDDIWTLYAATDG